MTTAVEVRTRRPLGEIARDIKAAQRKMEGGLKTTVEGAAEMGEGLIEAKEGVRVGEWGDWTMKNFHLSSGSAEDYMNVAREWAMTPQTGRALFPSIGAVLVLVKSRRDIAYLTDPEKAEQKILSAANDGRIPKQTARRLVDKVCDLRDEIKKNGTAPTTAATATKKALKDAIDYHARTPEQRKRVEAMDGFASIVKKGRAFTAALNGVIDSPHLEQLDQRAALFLLSTIWEAQLILEQIAGKHRRALKDADDGTLHELTEVENVRAELE